MKAVSVVILSSIILLVSLQDIISYANFKINRSYIADTLCINKAKPASCCKGICFLNSSLEENHSDNSDTPNTQKEERSSIVYPIVKTSSNLISKIAVRTQRNYAYCGLQDQLDGHRIFHPPCHSSRIF